MDQNSPLPAVPAKRYDLEDRTFLFAKRVRAFIKKLPHSFGIC